MRRSPPTYTFAPADQGTHNFTVSFATPGNQNVTVDVAGAVAIATTQQSVVIASPAQKLGGAVSGLIAGHVVLVNASNGGVEPPGVVEQRP